MKGAYLLGILFAALGLATGWAFLIEWLIEWLIDAISDRGSRLPAWAALICVGLASLIIGAFCISRIAAK